MRREKKGEEREEEEGEDEEREKKGEKREEKNGTKKKRGMAIVMKRETRKETESQKRQGR